jgi:hypothetical protein
MANDTNLLLGRSATASNSVAPYLPAMALNGNKTSSKDRWLASRTPAWICIDLQKVCAFSRWVTTLLPNAANPAWPISKYGMQSFKLQSSMDNVNWNTLDTVTGNSAAVCDRPLSNTAVARYLRWYSDSGIITNKNVASILELEVYGHEISPLLSSLSVSSGTLAPAFGQSTFTYTDQVSGDSDSITVTPVAVDSTATITVNGTRVVPGQNAISIVVTPIYGTPATYTVNATRPDPLALTQVVLNPSSARGALPSITIPIVDGQLQYNATLPTLATSMTVTPSAQSSTTEIKVNGNVVNTGTPSQAISTSSCPLTVNIQMTLPDKTTQRTYSITATK